MTTRIDAIRARLEAATKGPWTSRYQSHDNGGESYLIHNGPQYAFPDVEGVGEVYDDFDATFIAHAPEDIAYLLGRVEELEKDAGLNGLCLNAMHAADDIQLARIAALETEVAVLAEERGEAHSLWAKDKARLEAEVARLREGLRSALHEFAGQRHITGSRVRNVLDSLLSGSGEGG